MVNWFDKPEELLREGHYSILDSMEEDVYKRQRWSDMIMSPI